MARLGRLSLLLAMAVAVLGVTGCASSSALDDAQKSLAAATQRVGTLEEQLKASQAALTSAQSDLAKAQKDIAALTSDATTLKGRVTTTESDVATTKRNVTSLGSDLSALENSTSLTQADVTTVKGGLAKVREDVTKVQTDITKLNTTDPAEERAGLGILALDLYLLTRNTYYLSGYNTGAARVGDVVKVINDTVLTAAWTTAEADRLKRDATALDTAARDAANQQLGTSRDAFLLRLLQLIMG